MIKKKLFQHNQIANSHMIYEQNYRYKYIKNYKQTYQIQNFPKLKHLIFSLQILTKQFSKKYICCDQTF
ncbi:hypothetical protein pb186bvf_014889 [Paramecium bursaria]